MEEKGRVLSVPISCDNNDIYVLWNDTGLSSENETGDENVGGDDGTHRRIRCDCGDFGVDIDYDCYDCCYSTLEGRVELYMIYMVCT